MIVCKNCGFTNSDDSTFCENCGQILMKEQNKKRKPWSVILAVFIGVVILMAVLFFLFREKLPVFEKESGQKTEQIRETESTQHPTEDKNLKEDDETETEKPVEDFFADVKINGVDNAYVKVAGTIEEKDNSLILKLPEKQSVCAYNQNDEIIQGENIKYFILEADDMEEYAGAQVEIKGKLSAETSDRFLLLPVKTDVKQEAVSKEEKSYKSHQYELILKDVTWQEAFEDCRERGGYLLQINSEEEFQYMIQKIEEEDMQSVHFYLGGRREENGRKYYWVDTENQFAGEMLNPEGDTWAANYWMENEPSFTSDGEEEVYMNLMYYKDNWVLNDVPMDITMYYPEKTGYICEFDE